MSYILDALRKAEAERERGNVPSIHAQPAFAGAGPGSAPLKSRLWIVLAAVGAVLALVVVAVLYLLLGRSPASEVATPIVTPAPASVAVAPAVPVVPTPVAVAPPLQTAPPPVRKVRPASAPPVAATPASSATPKTDDRVYAINELPDDIRRQLPTLSVGGSMYSPKPANRIVIINGQVLHEGERIAPDLVVQQIKLKAAVLAFKGYRYSLVF